jgi:hypothetical protein
MIAASLLTCSRTIPTEFSAFFLTRWQRRNSKSPAGLVPIPIRVDDSIYSSRAVRRSERELKRLARIAGFTP